MNDAFDVFGWTDRLRFIYDTTSRMQKLRARYRSMSMEELKSEINSLGKRIEASRAALRERE